MSPSSLGPMVHTSPLKLLQRPISLQNIPRSKLTLSFSKHSLPCPMGNPLHCMVQLVSVDHYQIYPQRPAPMCVCPSFLSNLSLSLCFCLLLSRCLSLDLSVTPSISLFFVFHLQLLYTGKVSEDIAPGHFILKVSATDLDSDTNAQITYSLHGPGADEFKLDPHTGGFPELQD